MQYITKRCLRCEYLLRQTECAVPTRPARNLGNGNYYAGLLNGRRGLVSLPAAAERSSAAQRGPGNPQSQWGQRVGPLQNPTTALCPTLTRRIGHSTYLSDSYNSMDLLPSLLQMRYFLTSRRSPPAAAFP